MYQNFCFLPSFFGVDDFDPFPDLDVEVVDEDQIFDDTSMDSYEFDE